MTDKELDEEFKKSLTKCRIAFLKGCLKKNPKRSAFAEEYEHFKRLLMLKCGLPVEGDELND